MTKKGFYDFLRDHQSYSHGGKIYHGITWQKIPVRGMRYEHSLHQGRSGHTDLLRQGNAITGSQTPALIGLIGIGKAAVLTGIEVPDLAGEMAGFCTGVSL
jgi:hypothetical protein